MCVRVYASASARLPQTHTNTESQHMTKSQRRRQRGYNRFVAAVVVVAALLFVKIASEEFMHLSQHDAIDAQQGCTEWNLCQRATAEERATIADRCEHDRHRCERSYIAQDIVRATHTTLYKMLPSSLASFIDTVTSNTLFYSIALLLLACLVILWFVVERLMHRYLKSHVSLPNNSADVESRKKIE